MKYYQTLAVVQYYATVICASVSSIVPTEYQPFCAIWAVACAIATIYCLIKGNPSP